MHAQMSKVVKYGGFRHSKGGDTPASLNHYVFPSSCMDVMSQVRNAMKIRAQLSRQIE